MASENISYQELTDNEQIKKKFNPVFAPDHLIVNGCTLTVGYKDVAQKILDFEVREDDVFVCSFPRSGTTWTQEMVWCIAHNLDFETAKKETISKRFPILEVSSIFPLPRETINKKSEIRLLDQLDHFSNSFEFIKNLQGKRFIKTHIPFHLMPTQMQTSQRKAKVVYVARDPRDVCVSYYHFYKLFCGFIGDFSSFIDIFLDGKVLWAPYWDNVLTFWRIRHEPNMLFITYEEMKDDLPAVIQKVAAFLDKTLTPEQVNALAHHLSFDSMKNNESVNYDNESSKTLKKLIGSKGQFMRSGQSGGFVNELTDEEIERLNDWCRKNLEGTDYVLPQSKTT